ncbi:patatin-like phospholipase family protein [Bowmanella denitrificans]|uniref:patatin-like phospholipase family protein n=1 Tax=Bowmanella denitrificans TaxID=366582 RepID=UPI000C9CB55A|nr:patatin-like phospholipase family protein [Bowmanella denitrificans]
MTCQFRNLIFEGGGVKGIAYVGAMQVMAQRDYLHAIRRVGGTSAGAINALLFALGFDIPRQLQILQSTDFKAFMDDSFGLIRDIRRLAKDFGWHKGDYFSTWLMSLIEEKLGHGMATFADLQKQACPALYVTGTNLSNGYSEVFSVERHAQMPLVQAIRISMSIPLFFAAVRHGPKQDLYVDGGVMRNYPIKLFDRQKYIDEDESDASRNTAYYNKENALFLLQRPGRSPYIYNRQTLGLRLDKEDELAMFRYDEPPKGKAINNFSQYAKALITALMQVQENQHLHSDDWQRTLYINTKEVGSTDFDLTEQQKQMLLQQGILGAEQYFQWFEDSSNQPVNRLQN